MIKNTIATEENALVYEQSAIVYDNLMATETLEAFWQIMMAEENKEAVLDFTSNEISALTEKVNTVYNSIENPTADDIDYKDMLLETFTSLLAMECPECHECGGHTDECSKNIEILPADGLSIPSDGTTISATTISGNNTVWTFTEEVTVTLSGTITIPNGKTLTINGPGSFKRNTGNDMFLVKQGGTLIINDVIINGNNVSASGAVIHLDVPNNSYPSRVGGLTLNSVTIKDCNRTSGMGGAIKFGDDNSYRNKVECSITNTIIDNCDAPQGSAIMMHSNCEGNIIIRNSTISNCDATASYAGTIRTQGNANCKLQIESCNITNNTSYNNGGGVYWNARGQDAYLTITGTVDLPTIISNNTAKNGGGVFLSGQSISVENTHIKNNTANYGGGIYMQIDSGSTTDGEDFSINVNSDASIQGNTATYGGAFAVTQNTGNAEYTGGASRKYNAYININGGTIGGVTDDKMNKATFDGGAFYISRQYGDDGAEYNLEVNITDGLIFGNMADRNGGAIYLADNATNSNAQVNVSGGTIGSSSNSVGNTAVNGGAIYISGGNFAMLGGTLTNNNATENGGAVYVSTGRYIMSGGLVEKNTAKNGGSAYVTGGSYTLSGGTISNNTATENGGAAYVNKGNFEMTGGTIGGSESTGNAALNGGALYIDGGDFLITSGEMTNNIASNVGGAVYADGGDIVIGIEGCTDENNKHESPNTHPNITGNTAIFGGGGFMTDGTITMYCGNLKSNSSNNQGTGNNVYMNGGTFQLEGGEIGEETNPGIVLVGGQLNDTRQDDEVQGEEIKMIYYSCLDSNIKHETSVTLGKYINLPAAQEGWVKDGYTMVGWTTIENAEVKTFEDYKSVGMAVKVEGEKQVNYYAVWVKTTSYITYELDEGSVEGTNVNSYDYIVTSKNIHLISPQKQDYTFIGWRLTASEESITNWESEYPENEKSVFYEVANPDSGLDLNIGTYFGDITLTAIYKSNASDIEIVVKNENAKNQNYIFEISETSNRDSKFTPIKIIVKCDENGEGRTTVKELGEGTYTVSLQENWNWRYKLSDENINSTTNIDIDESQDKYTFTFEDFIIKNSLWLNAYNLFVKNGN